MLTRPAKIRQNRDPTRGSIQPVDNSAESIHIGAPHKTRCFSKPFKINNLLIKHITFAKSNCFLRLDEQSPIFGHDSTTLCDSTRDPCDSWLDSTRALISVTRDSTRTRPSWLVTRLGTRPKWLVNSSVCMYYVLSFSVSIWSFSISL